MMKCRALLVAAALVASFMLVPVWADSPLDDGMLDPAWFGEALEFREAKGIDYLWVEPGFTLEGRTLRFAPWEEAEFRGEDAGDRDAEDRALAGKLTASLPVTFTRQFKYVLGSRVPLAESGEQVTAVGRLVDCSAGSGAAKAWVGMGAGAGSATFDLKFLDAATGELLAAVHHRVLSVSNSSTTESVLLNWANEFAKAVGKQGLDRLYTKGKRATE
jgi:hypothetical protein